MMDAPRNRLVFLLETAALEAEHLQDTAGDKLLPALLVRVGEPSVS